jgi:hypothetical protein
MATSSFRRTRGFGVNRTIELRGRADGSIERKYAAGGGEKAYEPEGAAWLREAPPMIVRRTGFNAQGRSRKYRSYRAPQAFWLKSPRSRRITSAASTSPLFWNRPGPSGALLAQTLEEASSEISSDHELGELLIKVGTTMPLHADEWDAYFAAFKSISSDWERRRALSAVVDAGLTGDALEKLIRFGSSIRSSFERASLLR